MERRRRILFVALVAALLLFLIVVFRQPLLAYVVVPVATVVWLLLRIFVLSIGQQIYWWALIFLVAGIFLFRLLWRPETMHADEPLQPNASMERVEHWRAAIRSNSQETGEALALKRDLAWLLTSMYATGQGGVANFQVREALERREIDLPEPAYAFLFANAPAAPRPSFVKHPVGAARQVLGSARRAPARWVHRWSGRAAADYYQAIDEVLTLMETSLEMEHDNRPSGTRDDYRGNG